MVEPEEVEIGSTDLEQPIIYGCCVIGCPKLALLILLIRLDDAQARLGKTRLTSYKRQQ